MASKQIQKWIQNSCVLALLIILIQTAVNVMFSSLVDPIVVGTLSGLLAAVAVGIYYGSSTASEMPAKLRIKVVGIYYGINAVVFVILIATNVFPLPAQGAGAVTAVIISLALFAAYSFLQYWVLGLGSRIGMNKAVAKAAMLQLNV